MMLYGQEGPDSKQIVRWQKLAEIPELLYSLILRQFYIPGLIFSIQKSNRIKLPYLSCCFTKVFYFLQPVLTTLQGNN